MSKFKVYRKIWEEVDEVGTMAEAIVLMKELQKKGGEILIKEVEIEKEVL